MIKNDADNKQRDQLTGLRTRHDLIDEFNFEKYRDQEIYIAICDLDDLHYVNDAYGMNAGDSVLASVARLIRGIFGDARTYRNGSDEFVIAGVFENDEDFIEMAHAANEDIAAIMLNGDYLGLACSFGYVHGIIESPDDLNEAIRTADRKMFEAKRLGKARVAGGPLSLDLPGANGSPTQRTRKSYEADELTGLSNLIHFRSQLEHMLKQRGTQASALAEDRLAMVYFNIQNFKRYNEQFGFDAGNNLLVLIGHAIQDAFPTHLAARLSGDQFMVAATASTAEDGIATVRKAFRKRQKDSSIWLKAGIYLPVDEDNDIGIIMDRAKIACDSIKGRRDVYFRYYDQELQNQLDLHRYVLENFEHALAEGWVKVFYQPIIRVATGEVCDEEALARWDDPELGIIPPLDFVPVLEEARLINHLDLHIVNRACENLARRIEAGLDVVPISVNLSRIDFELCDIVSEIKTIVDRHGVDRSMLSIEITESALTGNVEFLKGEVDRFRRNGFEVWMDDFGSDYSSLNVLKEYNFDLIKLDMGFLHEFDKNDSARIILAHLIGMAKELGLKTLVEGVETPDQYLFLRSIGCGRAQGFLFGKPCSYADVCTAITDGSYPPIEQVDDHFFYEAVGRVNLLRPHPVDHLEGHYVAGDTPAAIVELRDGEFLFLNASTTFREFLRSQGMLTMNEGHEQLNEPGSIVHKCTQTLLDACRTSGKWEHFELKLASGVRILRMRLIAEERRRNMAAALIVVDDQRD